MAVVVPCVASCGESREARTADTSMREVASETASSRRRAIARVATTDSVGAPLRSDTGRLHLPRVRPNFCEGEACSFNFPLVACTALTLRAADAINAPELGRVLPGDTVIVETGNLHIPTPGLVVMRRDAVITYVTALEASGIESHDSVRLAAGDSLLLLEYHGEGSWAVGYEGRWMIVDEFWGGPASRGSGRDDDALPAISVSKPEVINWLRLRPRRGETGWWREEPSHAVRPDWGQQCGRSG